MAGTGRSFGCPWPVTIHLCLQVLEKLPNCQAVLVTAGEKGAAYSVKTGGKGTGGSGGVQDSNCSSSQTFHLPPLESYQGISGAAHWREGVELKGRRCKERQGNRVRGRLEGAVLENSTSFDPLRADWPSGCG
jgi:hypothetical protein